jgi:hypothetical protein
MLNTIGMECKVVFDADFYDGFPSRKISHWFQTKSKFNRLVKEFKPDAIFIDRQRHFGLAAIEAKIPLLVHLRGDYWKEMLMAEETLYKSFPKRVALKKWDEIAGKCFQNSKLILPICKYLEGRVKEHYPQKNTATLYQGITPSHWHRAEGMSLKHPCVGLLEKVLKTFPHVTFYWVGDGPYRDYVLSALKKYENFKWLGPLSYPDKVREYLTEIDIYALISGIDMSPLTLLEAQLMEKPVIATNVGGIPELMKDGRTGFLVQKGNSEDLAEKLGILLADKDKQKSMGSSGRNFVVENFGWEKIAKDFVDTLKKFSIV